MVEVRVPNIANVRNAFAHVQAHYLLMPESIDPKYFEDAIDMDALNAALQDRDPGTGIDGITKVWINTTLTERQFTKDAIMAAEETELPWDDTPAEKPLVDLSDNFPEKPYANVHNMDEYLASKGLERKRYDNGTESKYVPYTDPSTTIEEHAEKAGIADIVTVTAADYLDAVQELGREPTGPELAYRVIGRNPEPEIAPNEYQKAVVRDTGRLALGGCIPSVTWHDLQNVIDYLVIFKGIITKEPDVKCGKPSMTPAEREKFISDEVASPIFKIMMHKLKQQLIFNNELHGINAKVVRDAGFPVSYISTTNTLVVEITKDNKLSWKA